MLDDIISDMKKKMLTSIEMTQKDFSGLRTGRVSASLLDSIEVESYGAKTSITHVAQVTIPDARTLSVQAWDKNMIRPIDKAIRDSGMGLNPQIDGDIIRVQVPDLTGERRIELSKIASKLAEDGRISIRNIRRNSIESVKKIKLPEDEEARSLKEIQTLTDDNIGTIDKLLSAKEKEILG
jgi:ribosome recycling factor